MRPKLIDARPPELSAEQRAVRGIAPMMVKCTITTAGAVVDCCILRGINGYNATVLEALAHWRYEPATLQGKPVSVRYVIAMRLDLTP